MRAVQYGVLALALCAALVAADVCDDHQSHAVPGEDVEVFDLNGDGKETVALNGELSHSHYFEAGPPVVNGKIVSYNWVDGSGKTVCSQMKCNVDFGVGVSKVVLTVMDQTGDSASDDIVITVKEGSGAVGLPGIATIDPGSGSTAGGNTVTLTGENFYRDAKVDFGNTPATDVNIINVNKITVKAPASAAGTVYVTVSTSQGRSNGKAYQYTAAGGGAVAWRSDVWKSKDGSTWQEAQEVTGITVGPDGRYYMSTLVGKVWAVDVDTSGVVQSSCSGAQFPEGRALYDIKWNPKDPADRLVVTSVTMFFGSVPGTRWDNGKVEFVDIDDGGCVSRGETIISGLPMSDHDHGCGKVAFHNDGTMYLTCGGATNAGVEDPEMGNVPESPLSAAILEAPYLKPGFDGTIKYSQYSDPGTADQTGGDVSVFSSGFRSSFGLLYSSKGLLYATENGPNSNFGAKSTGCDTQEDDPTTQDTLHLLSKGTYHGHPNRNRGRYNEAECKWKGPGHTKPIGYMRSSTNGIMEYTANTFGGKLKGNLILTKLAWLGLPGKVWQVDIDENGNAKGNPYEIWGESGNNVVLGKSGEIIMPQVKQYKVLVLYPDTGGSVRMSADDKLVGPEVHNVHPSKGLWTGGNEILVTGKNFRDDSVVRVGGVECEYTEMLSPTLVSCQAPPGRGRAAVTVTQDGLTSPTYGTDYEWI